MVQADVCHSYQILKKNGFPDDNIIVMRYDDLEVRSFAQEGEGFLRFIFVKKEPD